MANDPMPDDLRNLWRDQPLENMAVSLNQIRERAVRFEKRIDRRNLREYIGGLIGVAIYSFYIWKLPNPLMRIGSAMIIAGVLFVMWQLYRRGRAPRLPEDLAFTASIEFHRRQLVQQRDLLRTVFRWYVGPLIPGLLVFLKGALPSRGFDLRYLPRMAPFLLLVVAVFGFIWWINKRAADRLDRQIAELDRMEKQS